MEFNTLTPKGTDADVEHIEPDVDAKADDAPVIDLDSVEDLLAEGLKEQELVGAHIKKIAPQSDAIPEVAMRTEVEAAAPLAKSEDDAIFMSAHKSLVINVMVPIDKDYELDTSGRPRRTSVGLQFKHGIFKSTDKHHTEGLREALKQPGMSQMFREATDLQTAAILQETHKRAEALDAGVQGGVATAGLNDVASIAMQARLKQMQEASMSAPS